MKLIHHNLILFETQRKDLHFLEKITFLKDIAHNYLFPMKHHTITPVQILSEI